MLELKREGIELAKEPGDDELLREGTVDFYSFSYYSTDVCAAHPEEHGARSAECQYVLDVSFINIEYLSVDLLSTLMIFME